MINRLVQLYLSVGTRDLVQIAILALGGSGTGQK